MLDGRKSTPSSKRTSRFFIFSSRNIVFDLPPDELACISNGLIWTGDWWMDHRTEKNR